MLAGTLYKKAHNDEFHRLVLVEALNALGELRGKRHQEGSRRVVGGRPKPLIKHLLNDTEAVVKGNSAAV